MKKKIIFKKFPWISCALSGKNYLREAVIAEKEGVNCLEIRFDLIDEKTESVAKKIREKTTLPLIATFRVKAEGGKINNQQNRYHLFASIINYVDLVDIEFNFLNKELLTLVKEKNKKLIISYHNLTKMPAVDFLNKLIQKAKKYKPYIIKIAVKTNNDKENEKLLYFLSKHKKYNLAAMALGETGNATRIAAPILGSCLTFGYVGKPTAEGQWTVKELVEQLKLFL